MNEGMLAGLIVGLFVGGVIGSLVMAVVAAGKREAPVAGGNDVHQETRELMPRYAKPPES